METLLPGPGVGTSKVIFYRDYRGIEFLSVD